MLEPLIRLEVVFVQSNSFVTLNIRLEEEVAHVEQQYLTAQGVNTSPMRCIKGLNGKSMPIIQGMTKFHFQPKT